MPYLHTSEKTHFDEKLKTRTVIVETNLFSFEAVGSKEGDVNVYVEWGDDQDGDMASHDSWVGARSHFQTLLKTSQATIA